ncbi:MAG: tetratricopeptide repeat protein [Pseudomonadota bacterium]
MQISSPILILLVLLGLCAAWLVGYRSRFRKFPGLKRRREQEYFIGLNYLLNDEHDDAIDIFIGALAISSGTLETHLALCTLLRRRGEVDRAISHCQYLVENKDFTPRELGIIKLNLVRSYIAAGLYDRAENLLAELQNASPPIKAEALSLAITAYQMVKDWGQALNAAKELLKICAAGKRPELQLQTSHFHCELAEIAMNLNDLPSARDELQKALQINRNNTRIYMLIGKIETLSGNYQEAVRVLQKIEQQDANFAGEVTAALLDNMQKAGMDTQISWMLDAAQSGNHGAKQLREIVTAVDKRRGNEAALDLLKHHLYKNPSMEMLAQTFSYATNAAPADQQEVLEKGAALLSMHVHNCPHYRCENCGVELKNLYWLCPGCSKWGMVRPIEGKVSYHQ